MRNVATWIEGYNSYYIYKYILMHNTLLHEINAGTQLTRTKLK